MTEVNKIIPGSKNNTCCCVYECLSVAKKHPDLTFHAFPKPGESLVEVVNKFGEAEKIDRRKAWERAIRIGKEVSRYMKVCSLHFQREDFIFPDLPSQRKRLKKVTVPSRNLPSSSVLEKKKDTEADNLRLERRLKRNARREKKKELPEVEGNQVPVEVITTAEDVDDVVIEARIESRIEALEPEATHHDIGVQVKSGDLTLRFVHFIKHDSELSTMTGLQSFDILRSIVKVLTLVGLSDRNATISVEDKVIMTYVKLKQNVSYACLAVMFNTCTEHHCRRIFSEIVTTLSQALKPAVSWPSREEISRNLPSCFKQFKDVVVVLDCTEVFIQRSKKLCCQLVTFSHYKGSNTCKIMTGVTPAGHISFISEAYGGRASDKAIFEQSNLIHLLQPGDAIMVDRGFLIDDMCRMNGWKCIRPPFLRNKKQFSKAEAVLTSKIACARVHIERSNQRLKTFKILGDRLPVGLVPLIEEIFLVVCATVNLSSPILKDNKFV